MKSSRTVIACLAVLFMLSVMASDAFAAAPADKAPADPHLAPTPGGKGGVEANKVSSNVEVFCPTTTNLNELNTCKFEVGNFEKGQPPATGSILFEAIPLAGEFPQGKQCTLGNLTAGKVSCSLQYRPTVFNGGVFEYEAFYSGDANHVQTERRVKVNIVRNAQVSVACSNVTPKLGQAVTCTTTAKDDVRTTDHRFDKRPPGQILFFSPEGGGEFTTPTLCRLTGVTASSSSCSATYLPKTLGDGSQEVKGAFIPDDSTIWSVGIVGATQVRPKHQTTYSFKCPVSAEIEQSVDCTIRAKDVTQVQQSQLLPPSGAVSLTTNGIGVFRPAAQCTLAQAGQSESSCTVSYTPRSVSPTSHLITATIAEPTGNEGGVRVRPIEIIGGVVHFAAPNGAGASPCEEVQNPCQLARAARSARAGEEVILAPGVYTNADLGEAASIDLKESVRLHGAVGAQRPEIRLTETDEPAPAIIVHNDDFVSDLKITDTEDGPQEGFDIPSLLKMEGGTVDNVVVEAVIGEAACEIVGDGSVLRDSVCKIGDQDGFQALEIHENANLLPAGHQSVVRLRNDTLISGSRFGLGLEAGTEGTAPSPAPSLTVKVSSTILQGAQAGVKTSGIAFPINVELDHSDYATIARNAPGSITQPGTGSNITTAPLFGPDGFHQLGNSPTLNKGALDEFSGASDVDDQLRELEGASDIGADEFSSGTSTTELACEPSHVKVGSPATCTATVRDPNGTDPIEGLVTFSSNGKGHFQLPPALGQANSCKLTSAVHAASCQIVFVPTAGGVASITGHYGFEGNRSPSEATVQLPIASNSESFFACNPNPVGFHEGDTFVSTECKATVVQLGEGATQPFNGKFDFSAEAGGEFSPQSCDVKSIGGGQFGCETEFQVREPAEAGESFPVKAQFNGDQLHENSAAATEVKLNLVPGAPDERTQTNTQLGCTEVNIHNDPNPTINCLVRVANRGGQSTPQPTGRVELSSEGAGVFTPEVAQVGELADGIFGFRATFKLNSPPQVGDRVSLFADYEGDAAHQSSKAGLLFFVSDEVEEPNDEAHPTGTEVRCGVETVIGRPTSCSVIVTDTSATPNVPTGEGFFQSDGPGAFPEGQSCDLNSFGSDRSACTIQYTPTSRELSTHKITGKYLGDEEHLPSEDFDALRVLDGDRVELVCDPINIELNGAANCAATVTDTTAAGLVPTGPVEFEVESSRGVFEPGTECELEEIEADAKGFARAACEVAYRPDPKFGGLQTLNATYHGDAAHGLEAGSFVVATEEEEKRAVRGALFCEPSSVGAGGSVNCEAVVTDGGANPTVPTGQIEFGSNREGDFSSQACDLQQTGTGIAACDVTYSPKQIGAHHLSAAYAGDEGHQATISIADVELESEQQEAERVTETELACIPNELNIHNKAIVNCTATVSNHGESPVTGEINFRSGAAGVFSPATAQVKDLGGGVFGAKVSFKLTEQAAVGAVIGLEAAYEGDANHNSSEGQTQLTVVDHAESPTEEEERIRKEEEEREAAERATKIEVACPPSELNIHDRSRPVVVNCFASLDDHSSRGALSGAIEFSSGGAGVFSPASVEAVETSEGTFGAQVSFRLTKLAVAGETITVTAAYVGDANHDPSTGEAHLTVVDREEEFDPTTTTLETPAQIDINGTGPHEVETTATVTDISTNPLGDPTGEVEFTSENGEFAPTTAPVEEVEGEFVATATFTVEGEAQAGTPVSVSAEFLGDTTHEPSSDTKSIEIVNTPPVEELDPTTTTLETPAEININGTGPHEVETTATVTDLAEPPLGDPTGEVEFTSENGEFAPTTVPVEEVEGKFVATATFTVEGEAQAGTPVSVSAEFLGDTTHEPSSDTKSIEIVNTPPVEEPDPSTTFLDAPAQININGEGPHKANTTATVTDTAAAPQGDPTGEVEFTSPDGEFAPTTAPVDLVEGEFVAAAEFTVNGEAKAGDTVSVKAEFLGDETHEASFDTKQLTVVNDPGTPAADPTTTAFNCAPTEVGIANPQANKTSTCTATVTDNAGTPQGPVTGQVKFTSAAGAFAPATAAIEELSPGVFGAKATFTLGAGAQIGNVTVNAEYEGDATHAKSNGVGTIKVVAETKAEEGIRERKEVEDREIVRERIERETREKVEREQREAAERAKALADQAAAAAAAQAAAHVAPDTVLGKHPLKVTKKTAAVFTFTSTQAPATFEYSLDGKPFKLTGPTLNTKKLKKKVTVNKRTHKKTVRFVFKLKNGKHTFQVRAKNAAGEVDATPATYTWQVGKVKKKHKKASK